jgi:glycosyltransferase involved in cell wall biosynthesis
LNTKNYFSVCILIGTYNGEKFIRQQLDSIISQTFESWQLVISDDGSSDKTKEIILGYKKLWSEKIQLRNGPQKGFAENFLSMACDKNLIADYYAFCDQDDVWLPQKLELAINQISNFCNNNEPFLYCGRTVYVDEKLNAIGHSTLFQNPPSFENALVQSIAGGNTMVFNRSSKLLIETVGLVPTPSHDWWLYQLISGGGGKVYFDSTPLVLYRQHENSIVGENTSFFNKFKRLLILFDGRFKEWTGINIKCLEIAKNELTHNANESLNTLKNIRQLSFLKKILNIKSFRYYRQSNLQNLILKIAFIMNKV